MSWLGYGALITLYYPVCVFAVFAGGWWPLSTVVAMIASQVLFDNLMPPDAKVTTRSSAWGFDMWLFAHLPAAVVLFASMLWVTLPLSIRHDVASSYHVPIGAGYPAWSSLTQLGLLAGFILSSNTIAAHELVHRINRPVQVWFGRLLLALTGDAQFSISHVFGHHARVATPADPASARRGETLYAFVVRSAGGQYVEAWAFERARLGRLQRSVWHPSNRVFTGLLPTVAIAATFAMIGGGRGLFLYSVAVLMAKFMFETVNYIQHYGLVRAPSAKVEPRHSWDCLGFGSTRSFYALTRHSEHHARPKIAYFDLKPTLGEGSVELRWGYLGAMVAALIPPLWFRLTAPMLAQWDAQSASPAERQLLQAARFPGGASHMSRPVATR